MTSRVVRERIDPRLTAALFSNYRTPLDALLELIDNAVDSRIPCRLAPGAFHQPASLNTMLTAR